MFKDLLKNVQEKKPLVHCITNYVTVNDVANALLACGGAPVMADEEKDALEITAISDALVINIGTLTERTIATMLKTGRKANELNHVTVFDPVGAGASSLRTDTSFKLLQEVKFSVIRGNISEIKTLAKGKGTTKGVDADTLDAIREENLAETIVLAQDLSAKTGAIVVISGPIDIVASSSQAHLIRNGHPMMAKVTGTGCMLTAVIAAYCAANPARHLEAAAAAVGAFGLSGELAFERLVKNGGGTSSYRTYLIDALSQLDPETLKGGLKIETR